MNRCLIEFNSAPIEFAIKELSMLIERAAIRGDIEIVRKACEIHPVSMVQFEQNVDCFDVEPSSYVLDVIRELQDREAKYYGN